MDTGAIRSKKKVTSFYIHSLIVLALMFGFGYLPANWWCNATWHACDRYLPWINLGMVLRISWLAKRNGSDCDWT